MPECSPQELIADAKCWYCYGQTDDIYDRLEILLLCKIKEGVLVPECNPLDLIEEAFCLTCTIPQQMWPAVKLALLCSIASGGSGGSIQIYQGAFADPNGNVTPDDPTKPALYFPNGGGTLWQFDVPSQTWV